MRFLFCFVLSLLIAPTSLAETLLEGQLDRRFGGGDTGLAAADFNLTANAFDEARDLVRLANGKLLMVAMARIPSNTGDRQRIAFARFNADGTLDPSFSGDGKLVAGTPNPEFDYYPMDMTLAPDGKYLLLATRSMDGQPDAMHVCRYNVSGSLDSSFNGNGCNNPVIGIDEGSGERGWRIAALADGSVLITGVVDTDPSAGQDYKAFVYKLTAQGVQDPVYGGSLAYVTFSAPGCSSICFPNDIDPAADGGAFVFGSNFASISWVAKLRADGTLDAGFAVGGISIFSYANLHNYFNARQLTSDSVIDAEGRIYHCGILGYGNIDERVMAITRLTAQGDVDMSFSGDGRMLMPLVDVLPLSEIRRCVIDPQGRLVVGIEVGGSDGVSSDYAVARFLPSGEPDLQFNHIGYVIHPVNLGGEDLAGHDHIAGMVLDQDGIVVAGTSNFGNSLTATRKLTMIRLSNDRILVDGFE